MGIICKLFGHNMMMMPEMISKYEKMDAMCMRCGKRI